MTTEKFNDENKKLGDLFNEDYFEKGIQKRISLYENYKWMPKRSLNEAKAIIENFNLQKDKSIIDFGCAKGFLVKAFKILGYDAYGTDISKYALNNCETEVKDRLFLLGNENRKFDFGYCKDTLEHSKDINETLRHLKRLSNEWLVIVPLAENNKYRINEYELDATHIIRKDEEEWLKDFQRNGFKIIYTKYHLKGLKDKWVKVHPKGNFFLHLKV